MTQKDETGGRALGQDKLDFTSANSCVDILVFKMFNCCLVIMSIYYFFFLKNFTYFFN